MSASPHRMEVRVYYEDTDFSGVVYHAGYLRFLERGRTELLRAAGVDQSRLFAEGLGFAVRRMTIDFARPARMDDLVAVETRVEAARGASFDLAQRILRGDEILIAAEVQVAAVAAGRAVRIPDAIRESLAAFGEALS